MRSDRRRLGRSERAKAEKQTGQPGNQKQQGVTRPRAQSGACCSGSPRSCKLPLVTHQPGGAPRVAPCGAAPRARPACSPAPPLDTRLQAPGKSPAGQGSPTLGYPTPAPRTCRPRPARPLRPGGAARAPRARSLPPPARAAARPRRCPAPCLRPAATSVTAARRAAADPAQCAPALCGQRRRLAHCARSGAPIKRSASPTCPLRTRCRAAAAGSVILAVLFGCDGRRGLGRARQDMQRLGTEACAHQTRGPGC